MNTALEYSTRVVQEGGRSKKSTLNENDVGQEGHSNSGSVWHCGDQGLF
jgi:hypothetical protein